MKQMGKVLPLFLLLALAVMVVALPAQTQQSQMGSESSATGKLTRVDTNAQTLTIKPENGDEMTFRYDANTKVEGSQTGVQGLSSQTGNKLTVWYTEQSGNKLATRISITQ